MSALKPSSIFSSFDTWESVTTSVNYENLPPLLPIHDQQLLVHSLTHKTYAQQLHLDDEIYDSVGLELESYKQLETAGDTLLHFYSTFIILQRCPGFTSSALTVSSRSLFVSYTTQRHSH